MIKLTPFQWAAFNFFGFFCSYGVLLPFLPIWLKHYGYSAETIGILASVGYLFRFLGGILASQKVKNVGGLIPIARRLTWLNLAVTIALVFSVENAWLLFICLMIFHIFNAGAMPIAESIASVWQQQIKLDYGKARLFGSLAFVIGSISTGYLISDFGNESIIFILAAFLLLLGLGQCFNPTIGFQQSPLQQQTTNTFSYRQILSEPTTLRMLIAVSLILASHAAYYTYSTIYWASLGISTSTISLLWGLAVIAEIALFFVAKRFFTKINLRHLLVIAILGTLLRWVILAITTDIALLTASQTLHSMSFALTHFAMVRYISTQETAKIAKLQGLYFGLASCAVMAIFTFVSGFIYPISPPIMFATMAACVIPAIFIVPRKFHASIQ